MNFYNDIEPFACDSLEDLIAAKRLPQGRVDRRSIKEVEPSDVQGFKQCHWFCGIGGWPLALKLAGWETTRSVWTASLPCQPFSVAAERRAKGMADERHLWPDMLRLVRAGRPELLFGEQVPRAITWGWLDVVFADLEAEGYTCGAIVLGAHSIGARQKRDRIWWGAHAGSKRRPRRVSHNRLSVETKKSHAVIGYDHSLARRALDAAGGGIRHCDGVPVALARKAIAAYGNAIVPQVAAEFIAAFMECVGIEPEVSP